MKLIAWSIYSQSSSSLQTDMLVGFAWHRRQEAEGKRHVTEDKKPKEKIAITYKTQIQNH